MFEGLKAGLRDRAQKALGVPELLEKSYTQGRVEGFDAGNTDGFEDGRMWERRHPTQVMGAIGSGRDVDSGLRGHEFFRSLGALVTAKDLDEHVHREHIKRANESFVLRYLAERILTIKRDFIIGKGFQWEIETDDEQRKETLQEVMGRFWTHPTNRMAFNQLQFALSLWLEGELILPFSAREEDGTMELGFIEPSIVKAILPSPMTKLVDKWVILRNDLVLKIVQHDPETLRFTLPNITPDGFQPFTLETLAELQAEFDDDREFYGLRGNFRVKPQPVLYWAVNRPLGATRGRSDLLTVLDNIDLHNDTVYNIMLRTGFQNSFIYHVTVEGATSIEDLKRISKQMGLGHFEAGQNVITTSAVKIDEHAPQLAGSDNATIEEMMVENIAAGGGIPAFWLARGGETNFATAKEMNDPTFKMLQTNQTIFAFYLQQLLHLQTDLAVAAREDLDAVEDNDRETVQIVIPELTSMDPQASIDKFQKAVAAFMIAKRELFVTDDEAREAIRKIIKEIGINLKTAPEEEEKKPPEKLTKEEEAFFQPGTA